MPCSGARELQKVTVKILAVLPSSSSCERNWSAYDFIHDKKRNKLAPERANDLVFVFSNMQLVRRQERINARGEHDPYVPWQWFDSASEESEQDD